MALVSTALILCLQGTGPPNSADAFIAQPTPVWYSQQSHPRHPSAGRGSEAGTSRSTCHQIFHLPLHHDIIPDTSMSVCATPFGAGRSAVGVSSTALFASKEKSSVSSASGSWSRRGGGSRFGVRSRVKNVLKKARDRTGVQNSSEGPSVKSRVTKRRIRTERSSADIFAEAASLGGLEVFETPETLIESDVISNGSSQNVVVEEKKETPTPHKTSPASTYSPPVAPLPASNPEDKLVAGSKLSEVGGLSEMDAFKGDVSAAFSMPPEPLPFTLPALTAEQKRQLENNERVQFQKDMGREGDGFVVLDVKAPPDVVWECLLDFQSYPETIPTVRDVTMYTNTRLTDDYRKLKPASFEDGTMATLKHGIPSVTRAAFTLSKFRLKIAAIHKYRPHPLGDYMVFTLDPACTNLVLKAAKGVWHTQVNPDGKGEEYTRVWLLCEVSVSRLLPQWITDYAARRAMPRATTWLKPQVEAANALWLNKGG